MILQQRREHLARDVPLQAPDNVLLGEALLRASDDLLNRGLVPLHADQHDPIGRGIGLSVPAANESMPMRHAGRCRNGTHLTEFGERRLGAHAIWVIARDYH